MTIPVEDQFHSPILFSPAETESDSASHNRLWRGTSVDAC